MVFGLMLADGRCWKKLCFHSMAIQVQETAPADVLPLSVAQLCDYCESSTATGYVHAYDAHVCESCYEDHHGPIC